VTAFVTVTTLAVLMAAGLVVDGGRLLAARRTAVHAAEQAARVGAQELDQDMLRRRTQQLDPRQAEASARAHLVRSGVQGDVTLDGGQVHVRARVVQDLGLLRLVGLATVTVHGEGQARPVRGVREGET